MIIIIIIKIIVIKITSVIVIMIIITNNNNKVVSYRCLRENPRHDTRGGGRGVSQSRGRGCWGCWGGGQDDNELWGCGAKMTSCVIFVRTGVYVANACRIDSSGSRSSDVNVSPY